MDISTIKTATNRHWLLVIDFCRDIFNNECWSIPTYLVFSPQSRNTKTVLVDRLKICIRRSWDIKRLSSAIFLALGVLALLQGSYIQLKAELAQRLMQRAWHNASDTMAPEPPWPWADTHVIGIIRFHSEKHYILDNESGRNLAFGPSRMALGAPLGGKGNVIIVAHNDTHFSQLNTLKKGDIIEVEALNSTTRYKVSEYAIVDETAVGVLAPTERAALTLITCYPFDASTINSSQRYVVRALAM